MHDESTWNIVYNPFKIEISIRKRWDFSKKKIFFWLTALVNTLYLHVMHEIAFQALYERVGNMSSDLPINTSAQHSGKQSLDSKPCQSNLYTLLLSFCENMCASSKQHRRVTCRFSLQRMALNWHHDTVAISRWSGNVKHHTHTHTHDPWLELKGKNKTSQLPWPWT